MSDESSLLDEFRATSFKESRCVVCFKVTPEVRGVIEDGIRRGVGPVSIASFLRKRGLWEWSETPIAGHRRHLQP